ncbi:MAG: PilN domain-containing protein [Phycisphaerae bacterium]
MSIVNLLPDDYLKRRSQQRANILCCVLFLVVMVGVTGASLMLEKSSDHTEAVAHEVDEDFARASRLIDQLQMLEKEKSQLLSKASNTASLMERVPRSYLLGFVTNSRPKGVWLTEVLLNTKVKSGPAPPKGRSRKKRAMARPRGKGGKGPLTCVTMELVGLAFTDVEVARYITRLRGNPIVKSVELIYSVEQKSDNPDKEPLRSFQLTLQTHFGFDAADAIKPEKEDKQKSDTQVAAAGKEGADR